jgi:hypothetical protein
VPSILAGLPGAQLRDRAAPGLAALAGRYRSLAQDLLSLHVGLLRLGLAGSPETGFRGDDDKDGQGRS